MAGVTSLGFTKKTVEEIKAELETDQLETIDATLNLSADQPVGQLNAVFAKHLADVWALAEVAYSAFDRDAAEGRLLDNIGSITGTPREPARKSLVTCTVNLGASFSQPAGALMANVAGQPDIKFVNRDAVTSTTSGNYTAVFESIDYGPVVANAGTLTQITAAVSGWNSITNAADAELGALEEGDTDYRQRQADELTAPGACTTDAIRADLLKVKGVLQAFCFENVTLTTDADGLPGKAIECVIYDGASPTASNNEVAQAIWNSKPSGSETYGAITAYAVDALGITRTVKFSRATIKNVYLEFDITVDASKYPIDGAALVKAAAVEKGNTLNLGDDVIALALRSSALSVQGVLDVTAMRLGFSASPVGLVNLAISGREIARFDTSRVTVTVV